MATTPVRIPDDIHSETKQLAAMRGQQQGDLLATAWREYLERHKDQFAADLEQAARILRDGTTSELAEFASRNAPARAKAAAARIRSKR